MHTIQDHRSKRERFEKTFSSSNLESINLEDEDIPHVPNVLEKSPNKKAENERLKKQKSKEGYNFKYGRLIKCHDGRKKKNEWDKNSNYWELVCLVDHE